MVVGETVSVYEWLEKDLCSPLCWTFGLIQDGTQKDKKPLSDLCDYIFNFMSPLISFNHCYICIVGFS